MAISINSSASGFRKWSEAQQLKRVGEASADAGIIALPEIDKAVITPDETPHRPWLVPGAGTL